MGRQLCWPMFASVVLMACKPQPPAFDPQSIAGDAGRGRLALRVHECGICHVIPGVSGARGQVGPPLSHFRRHVYIAGKFPNEPATLRAWLLDPPAMAEQTAMPAVGVTEQEARDMAAYLYTLQ
jgi:cytochrome c2